MLIVALSLTRSNLQYSGKGRAAKAAKVIATTSKGRKAVSVRRRKLLPPKLCKLQLHDGPRRKLTSLVFLFALLLFLEFFQFANWELRLNGTNALIPAG